MGNPGLMRPSELSAKRLAILQDLINEVKPSMLSMAKAIANLTDEEFRTLLTIAHKHVYTPEKNIHSLRDALVKLAAFEDSAASEYLEKYESYYAFKEPFAVHIARETLKAVGYVHEG